eukprot:scaffold115728_cov67-Phaeocystis_antarctica.AAC.4
MTCLRCQGAIAPVTVKRAVIASSLLFRPDLFPPRQRPPGAGHPGPGAPLSYLRAHPGSGLPGLRLYLEV